MTVFTGEELAKGLAEGGFKEPIVRVGMVKRAEDGAGTILFAMQGCGRWTSIPVELIAQATFLKNVPCKDHEHPLVMLTFKEPPAGDAAATLFAELARQPAPSAGPEMGGGMMGGGIGGPGMPGGHGGGMGGGVAQRQAGGVGGVGGGQIGQLECIAWHQECGWRTLWIPSLRVNIPIYVCWNVCDTYM